MLTASMIVIGDELLSGHVVDANTAWLAGRLHRHGVPLTRVHVVADDTAAIDEALTQELARSRPRLVFTSGGIGSTPDDITYAAVAASLGRSLVEDAQLAASMDAIMAATRAQGFAIDAVHEDAIRRMSRIPSGSRVLATEGRWLPAVVVDVDGGCHTGAPGRADSADEAGLSNGHDPADGGASVIVLPGVPAAFRALIEQVIEPGFFADRNPVPVTAEIRHPFPESLFNGVFARIVDELPTVKLGSYPGQPTLVRLTGRQDEVAAAKALVDERLAALRATPAGQAWVERIGLVEDVTDEETR